MRFCRSILQVACTLLFMSVWVHAQETQRLTDIITEKPCIVDMVISQVKAAL